MSKKKLNRGGIAWRCMFLITAKRWLLVDRLSTLWLFGLSIERKLIFALSITQTCMPNCLYLWRHIIRVKSVLDCIRTFSYKVSLLQVFTVFSNNLFTSIRSIFCIFFVITFFAKFVHQNYPFSYVISYHSAMSKSFSLFLY